MTRRRRGGFDDLETRRLGIFLAVAFGTSWAVALLLWVTGWYGDPPLLGGAVPATLVLLGFGYMFGPTLGNVAARALTDEGRAALLVNPRADGWPYWAVAWLLPVAFVLVGAALFFALFPDVYTTRTAAELTAQLESALGITVPSGIWGFAAFQVVQAALLAPVLNSISTFGEEFGWRGYLLPKLQPLGPRRAALVHGAVWSVWHWPLIAMGHNYGLGYPGAPWTGFIAMTVFTVSLGVVFAWLTFRAECVWPAVLAHAMVNGIAGIGLLFATDGASLLLGPAPSGVIACLPWIALAAYLLWKKTPLEPPERLVPTAPETDAADDEDYRGAGSDTSSPSA